MTYMRVSEQSWEFYTYIISFNQLCRYGNSEKLGELFVVIEQVHGGHSLNPGIVGGKIDTTVSPGMFLYFFLN